MVITLAAYNERSPGPVCTCRVARSDFPLQKSLETTINCKHKLSVRVTPNRRSESESEARPVELSGGFPASRPGRHYSHGVPRKSLALRSQVVAYYRSIMSVNIFHDEVFMGFITFPYFVLTSASVRQPRKRQKTRAFLPSLVHLRWATLSRVRWVPKG
jgi:hypothetical protein